jgi:hypothetical protein
LQLIRTPPQNYWHTRLELHLLNRTINLGHNGLFNHSRWLQTHCLAGRVAARFLTASYSSLVENFLAAPQPRFRDEFFTYKFIEISSIKNLKLSKHWEHKTYLPPGWPTYDIIVITPLDLTNEVAHCNALMVDPISVTTDLSPFGR